eukprot:gnl/Dysnectes_brevis/3725_a4775_952.p1 GENE.gnl/Dysnectes_brevis/3725_a4775_952~~gnl/Dysnectes_brevis/3725_a4775_952.p1  ORF type:complete len:270 (-),score=49.98 gnl/Dysnectes_brevis/3725_a4775_952:90-878(-)
MAHFEGRKLIRNWFEERIKSETEVAAYLEKKSKGTLVSQHHKSELARIFKPTTINSDGGKFLFPGDDVVIVNHNTRPLFVACDPRVHSRDVPDGYPALVTTHLSPVARTTFSFVRVPPKIPVTSTTAGIISPIAYGERVYIIAYPTMGRDLALSCEVTIGAADGQPAVVRPVQRGGRRAEFTIEPFHISQRLELEGMPVPFDAPVVLRNCSSGSCLGTGKVLTPHYSDLMIAEYQLTASSVLDQYRHETKSNLFTISVGDRQ